jgi:hypothetical protein
MIGSFTGDGYSLQHAACDTGIPEERDEQLAGKLNDKDAIIKD